MNFESVRHYGRYVINGAALAAAVLVLPELGPFLPITALPKIAGTAAILNTLVSWLKRV